MKTELDNVPQQISGLLPFADSSDLLIFTQNEIRLLKRLLNLSCINGI